MKESLHRWKAPTDRELFIRLDLNEGVLSSDVCDEIIALMNIQKISMYPEYDELLSLIEMYTEYSKQHIVLTNGADQAIDLLTRTMLSSRRVLLPSPVFSFYSHCLTVENLDFKPIPYEWTGQEFIFPTNKILDELTPGDAIIICSPNNPLGARISTSELDKILNISEKLNIFVILDECYKEFSTSITTDKYNSGLIAIVRTFSKYFSLAGARLGYILTTNKENTELLLSRRGPWDVNAFAVSLGEFCIRNIDLFRRANIQFQSTKILFEKQLENLGCQVIKTETNFCLIKTFHPDDMVNFFRFHKILITSLRAYPDSFGLLDSFVRVTIPSESDLDYVLSVFRTYFNVINK